MGPQREVLFAYLNFSLFPTPPSTRTSRCIVEKFVTPLKEKFSLPISIFHSLLPHPQREVLFVSLTTSSTSTPHLKEKFSLHISLSPPPPSTRTSRCIVEKFVTLLKEKFSLPISIFHSLLPHPQRELLVVSLKNL